MSGSVNKVILVGNLGRDPEVRHNQQGDKIVSLNIATSESWKDRATGERKEKTEWHRVVIFNTVFADIAERYLKKGSKVYIEGRMQTRKWTDQQGQERYTTEVIVPQFKGDLTLLGGPNDGEGNQQGGDQGYSGGGSRQGGGSGRGGSGWEPPPELDDEIPFADCSMFAGVDFPNSKRCF